MSKLPGMTLPILLLYMGKFVMTYVLSSSVAGLGTA
jgi:hypothetical protein